MGDERERMAQDIDALKARLLKVTKQWEALYGVLFVKAQRLTDENARLRDGWNKTADEAEKQKADVRIVFDQNNAYYAEIAALRGALQALVDAMKLMRAPHRLRTSGIGTGNCVECREIWPCFTERVGIECAAAAAAALLAGPGGET